MHTVLVEMENGAATLETLPQFLKRLNAAIIQPANCTPGHLAQKNENLWFTRKLVRRFS